MQGIQSATRVASQTSQADAPSDNSGSARRASDTPPIRRADTDTISSHTNMHGPVKAEIPPSTPSTTPTSPNMHGPVQVDIPGQSSGNKQTDIPTTH